MYFHLQERTSLPAWQRGNVGTATRGDKGLVLGIDSHLLATLVDLRALSYLFYVTSVQISEPRFSVDGPARTCLLYPVVRSFIRSFHAKIRFSCDRGRFEPRVLSYTLLWAATRSRDKRLDYWRHWRALS